ncbi:histidine kinase N-terminal 7TM domain-containing protein [Methanoregula sp.]|uniref:histidine kinase N-terminal 7TM domain-containing protein n=1 Tax=Methanoregula sp. TaxID=2052170 RepID=UPI00236B4F38|nr:histidine kinase N-terminal 7TM domain-containing protein [Methanoregula sp.]MDD1686640.1 ATP-binding protein [Methanoregula sp.]
MIIQNTPFLVPLLISAAITGILAVISLKHRDAPIIRPFILLMCATTLWTVMSVFQLESADLASNILFNTLEYPGIVSVPIAWLLIVLCYTGREHLVTLKNTLLLFIVPAIVLILVATNPYHHLYYTTYIPDVVNGIVIWNFVHGPLFWIHAGYSYLLTGIALLLIASRFFSSPVIYRKQILLLLIAAGAPTLVNILYVMGFDPVPGLDLTPVMFMITGIILVLAIIRYQLFSLAPVAYPVIFTAIDAGIIVLDRNDRISDLNPAALKIFNETCRPVIGQPVTDTLLPGIIAFLQSEESGRDAVFPVTLQGRNGAARDYEVACRTISAGAGEYCGRLLMIRDVTEMRQASRAIETANRKLNLLSSITRHDMLNKLTGLATYLELAKEEKEEATLHTYIENMVKISRVLQEELEFTRDYQDLGVKTPTWQNVNTLVQPNVAFFPAHYPRVEIAIHPVGLEIYADPLLEKVFYNLIDNALRYGGGKMNMIRVTSCEENGSMIITFADNGEGIAAKDKPLLFTKGFGKNTGLGLFLSREILSITGITIRENGTPGEGARFEITVPCGEYRSSVDTPEE